MNGEMYSYDVINRYSDKLFDAVLSSFNPIIGSMDYLRRMHKSFLIKKEINTLSKKKKELITTIIDLLPEETSYKSYVKLEEKFKEIEKNPNFKKSFAKLDKLFKDITEEERTKLVIVTATKMNKNFLKMRNDISHGLIKTIDTENMIVLGQALRCMEFILKELIENMKKRSPDTENMKFCMSIMITLLTKILAIYFGKMEYKDLYPDIAFVTLHTSKTHPQFLGKIDGINDSVFAILGEENE